MTVHSWGHAIDIASAQNNINYVIKKAQQYANERDAAEADCKKLKGEIRDHKEENRQLTHEYNALAVRFNNMFAEKNEVIEDLEDDVKDYMRIVNQQDAEIAQLKALLEEHGISTEPSGGMKP